MKRKNDAQNCKTSENSFEWEAEMKVCKGREHHLFPCKPHWITSGKDQSLGSCQGWLTLILQTSNFQARQLKEERGPVSPDTILELFLRDSQIANPLDLGVKQEALPTCLDVFANQNEELKADWLDALPDSDSNIKEIEVRTIKDKHTIYGAGIGFIPQDIFMDIRKLDFMVHTFSAV